MTAFPNGTGVVKTTSTSKKAVGGWLAAAILMVGAYEGLSLTAYPDIVNVPTICYGETKNVHMGDTSTKAQCDEQLSKRLREFNDGVNSCVKVDLPDTRRVALVSLSYNIGINGFCKSTVVRLLNRGDVVGGCNAILMWDMAGGKHVAGLTRRRQGERELCLKGEPVVQAAIGAPVLQK